MDIGIYTSGVKVKHGEDVARYFEAELRKYQEDSPHEPNGHKLDQLLSIAIDQRNLEITKKALEYADIYKEHLMGAIRKAQMSGCLSGDVPAVINAAAIAKAAAKDFSDIFTAKASKEAENIYKFL